MLYRLRANVRFTKSSGLATWARDQMNVRHGQAVHINEGLSNEEPKYNEILEDDTSTDHEVFSCDLPLMDEAHAQDAFNTLTDASVFNETYVSAFPGEGNEDSPSWVERHNCYHDENPPNPCVTVERKTLPES